MLKNYIGAKIIKAEFEEKQGMPGYTVYYPDNYVSWSPQEVFETAYREVTKEEIELLSNKGD